MIVTPTNVDFGTDENKALEVYVKEHIQALKDGLRDLHESKLPKWRRLYRGRPKEEVKNFPWKNASNITVSYTHLYVHENMEQSTFVHCLPG